MTILSLFGTFKQCLQVLSTPDRRKYKLVAMTQALLGFLDLAGVALLGLIGALAIRGVQSKEPGQRINSILEFLRISDYSFQVQVFILAIGAVVFLISKTILSVFFTWKILFYLGKKGAEISTLLTSKILSQNLVGVQANNSLDIQYAIGSGVTAISIGILGSATTVLADIFLLLIIGVGITFVDPTVAFSSILIFGSIGISLYLILHKKAQVIGYLLSKYQIESNRMLNEVLYSYREVFVRNRRYYYSQKIGELKSNFANMNAEQAFLPSISKYVLEVSVTLGAVVIAAIQFLTQDAAGAAAGLAVFVAAGSRVAPALLRIQQGVITMQGSIGSATPTLQLLTKLEKTTELAPSSDLIISTHEGFEAGVSIQELTFYYPGTQVPVVNNISLEIKPGSMVAIVGPSGAGKTTLVDLILGIHTSGKDCIQISGLRPLLAVQKWPGAIAYVPQDVSISDATIKENVGLGYAADLISKEMVRDALKVAHLESFVNTLEGGIEGLVGERGTRLSGGQRQRLGIARAMFTKPKLLVLDEATSSLDAQTEQDISNSIGLLKGEVTIVLIAHRLSTIRNADQVVYMDNGTIRAIGTFEEVREQVSDFDRQSTLMGLI